MGKLKDEYIKENGLYFLGSFINNRVNDGVHTNYQDCTIDYEMIEKHNFDELSFASLLHTITKVIPESINMIEDLLSYYDEVMWYRDKENALKLLFDKLMPLDFNKVWLNIDIDDYCDISELIFKSIMKVISLDSFINKVNKCDDIELVYVLYMLYGKIHNISAEEINKKFILYLEEYIELHQNTYEELFLYHFATYRSGGNFVYKELVNLLFSKINLDCVIDEGNGKTTLLKNKIARKLYYGAQDKGIINTFLNLNPGIYFEGDYSSDIDIFRLNLIAGNLEKAKEIFNSDVYELYSLEQYNALKNDGYYDIEKYGMPVDRLKGVLFVLEINASIEPQKRKKALLDLIYSNKIKMVSCDSLDRIRASLTEAEYNEYIEYIEYVLNNNILIYNKGENNQIYCVNSRKEDFFVEVIRNGVFTKEFKIVGDMHKVLQDCLSNFYCFENDIEKHLDDDLCTEKKPYEFRLVNKNLISVVEIKLSMEEYEKFINFLLKNNVIADYSDDKKDSDDKKKKNTRVRRFFDRYKK